MLLRTALGVEVAFAGVVRAAAQSMGVSNSRLKKLRAAASEGDVKALQSMLARVSRKAMDKVVEKQQVRCMQEVVFCVSRGAGGAHGSVRVVL